MATCKTCGLTVLMGGIREENDRFCSKKCYESGRYNSIANKIPFEIVSDKTKLTHSGPCPKCKKINGAIDVHIAHRVWSCAVLTSSVSTPQISCRSCGVKAQSFALIYSFLLGWWGIPWGVIKTPAQIAKNLRGIISPPNPNSPSQNLADLVRLELAKNSYQAKVEK